MRNHNALSALAWVGLGLASLAGCAKSQPAIGADKAVLHQEQLAELERRVDSLEKEVQELKARPMVVPGSALRLPSPGRKLPDGSIEREFNGIKYYIVPLDPSAQRR